MTKKEFREYLNKEYSGETNHHHKRFNQRTRGYGDYLYYQDKVKFEVLYWEELTKLQPTCRKGREMKGFTDKQIKQMRDDLETNFAKDKFINAVKTQFKKDGKDFDKEFGEWRLTNPKKG